MNYGKDEIGKVYYGGAEIEKIYHGSDLVYTAEVPIEPLNVSINWALVPQVQNPINFTGVRILALDTYDAVCCKTQDNSDPLSYKYGYRTSFVKGNSVTSTVNDVYSAGQCSSVGRGRLRYPTYHHDNSTGDLVIRGVDMNVSDGTTKVWGEKTVSGLTDVSIYWAGQDTTYSNSFYIINNAGTMDVYNASTKTLIGSMQNNPISLDAITSIISGFSYYTSGGKKYRVTSSRISSAGEVGKSIRQVHTTFDRVDYVLTTDGTIMAVKLDANAMVESILWESSAISSIKGIMGSDKDSIYVFSKGLGTSSLPTVTRISKTTGSITGSDTFSATLPDGRSVAQWNGVGVDCMCPFPATWEHPTFAILVPNFDTSLYSFEYVRVTV